MMQKNLKNSLLFNAGLFLLMLILAYASYGVVRQAIGLKKEASDTSQKITELTGKKQDLEEKIAELQTQQARERTAKERLNLKNPGENVVVVVPSEKNNASSTQSFGWWDRFKNFWKNLASKL